MTNKNGTISNDRVAWGLLNMPGVIEELEKSFVERRHIYNARATELAIRALGQPLFPGKKPEDDKRIAANDTERDMAVKFSLEHDEDLRELAADLEAARRALTCAQNRLKSYRLIARLTLAGKATED